MDYETLIKRISEYLIQKNVPENKVLKILEENKLASIKYIKLKVLGSLYGIDVDIPIEVRINAGIEQTKKREKIEDPPKKTSKKSKSKRKLKPCKRYQKRNPETNRCIGRKPKKQKKSVRKNPWIEFVKSLRNQPQYTDIPYRELLKIASGLWKNKNKF